MPRVNITSISSDSSIDQLMDLIKEKKYSKIPLYDENIDKIRGIIYAKDILPYLIGSRPKDINISDFSKEPLFVPENKPIDDMLDEFKAKKTQIAIVVDEWGGTAGLVTVEDIVEEVLGEIRDPYDIEKDVFTKYDESHYMFDAKIGIYDIEEELDIEFPEDRDYDTLGGSTGTDSTPSMYAIGYSIAGLDLGYAFYDSDDTASSEETQYGVGTSVMGMYVGAQFGAHDTTGNDTDYMTLTAIKDMGAASFSYEYIETDEAGGTANDSDVHLVAYSIGF